MDGCSAFPYEMETRAPSDVRQVVRNLAKFETTFESPCVPVMQFFDLQ